MKLTLCLGGFLEDSNRKKVIQRDRDKEKGLLALFFTRNKRDYQVIRRRIFGDKNFLLSFFLEINEIFLLRF